MARWMYLLLLAVPAALGARLLGLPDLAIFALAAVGLIPLAGLIGQATEQLAQHLGPRFGGLLNATFGNAAELIITTFAINRGLLTLAKASITGSIIGNTLLVLGVALLVGGLKRKRLCFDPRVTSLNAGMMILAVAGLYLPATFAASVNKQSVVEALSLLVAGVLLVTYVAYLVFTVVQRQPSATEPPRPAAAQPGAAGETSAGPVWGRWTSLGMLAGATAGAAVGSELLVGTVESVTKQLGWSEFFIGVILVAIIGNAAEHYSAVQMAWKNQIDVTLAIAAGSSTQIALFVAPALVFLSLALGHPMDLIFEPLELAILGLATAIFAYLSLDGESNWLEGLQLLAVYCIAACAFFFLPFQRG